MKDLAAKAGAHRAEPDFDLIVCDPREQHRAA
ncbi:hypothetical protein SAMN05446935_7419 [Burkholderia sp. YR290]|nr:hypothetical protein SAMN05446935_7419 [Burkholderia sp. YR290]